MECVYDLVAVVMAPSMPLNFCQAAHWICVAVTLRSAWQRLLLL